LEAVAAGETDLFGFVATVVIVVTDSSRLKLRPEVEKSGGVLEIF